MWRRAVAAAVAAALVGFVALSVPRARLELPASFSDETIPGILHVHTNRSDGRWPPEDVAAAAARAGLKFLVFTDHGDATRPPDPPMYRSGVLCLDAVEISTNGGHYVALDMPAAPYPLGGEARDVVEDVHRLGGFGIVGHPDSPKPELAWRDWTAPFDGIEILNPDTSWRLWAAEGWHGRYRLTSAFFGYMTRPAQAVTSLLRPTNAPVDWAGVAARRRVVAVAGADAHARLALWSADPGDNRFSLPLPGYEAMFRTLSIRVRTARPLTGDAQPDARLLVQAIRDGHLHVAVDGLASPPALEFTAANRSGTAREGDELPAIGPVVLRLRSNAPRNFRTVVRNGRDVIDADHHEQDFTLTLSDRPAAYWVDIVDVDRDPPMSWLTSNAIFVAGPAPSRPAPKHPPPTTAVPLFGGSSLDGWQVEHDAESRASVEIDRARDGPSLLFRWSLAPGAPIGKFVTLARRVPTVVPSDRIAFTVRGERPMRISVQLRTDQPNSSIVERWQRTVFVDVSEAERTVYFDDVRSVGTTRTPQPVWSDVHAILFGIDATNTKPGASGELWIRAPRLEK